MKKGDVVEIVCLNSKHPDFNKYIHGYSGTAIEYSGKLGTIIRENSDTCDLRLIDSGAEVRMLKSALCDEIKLNYEEMPEE